MIEDLKPCPFCAVVVLDTRRVYTLSSLSNVQMTSVVQEYPTSMQRPQ